MQSACPFPITGIETPKQFRGDGHLVFTPNVKPIALPWAVSFAFRTRQSNGFLVRMDIGSHNFVVVEVRARRAIQLRNRRRRTMEIV